MKIRISIDKATALKAGKDKHGRVVVDVPAESLTQEQRNELAEQTWESREQPVADYYLDSDTTSRQASQDVAEATPDAIRLILDRLIAVRQKKKAAEAAEKAEKAAKTAAEIAEFKQAFAKNPSVSIIEEYRKYRPAYLLRCNHAELATENAWAESECERLNAERDAEEKRKYEAEKAQKEAGKDALKAWSGEHGSELLKARIEDGFEWLGLAEREYANFVVASLGDEIEIPDHDTQKESERTTPTIDEIKRLRAVRNSIEGKPAKAELVWAEYTEKKEEYDDEDAETKRTEIKVTVTCPTGREIEKYYAI